MSVLLKKVLYLTKSVPVREYAISKELKKQHVAEHVDAAVFSQRNWYDLVSLEEQTPVFNSIWNFVQFAANKEDEIRTLDVDSFLFAFENNNDVPLNFALHADRYLITLPEDKRRRMLMGLVLFCEEILSQNTYDAIIGELSSASDLIFYYVAQKRKIPYLFFWHGRIAGKMEFSDITGKRIGLKEIYEVKKREGLSQQEQDIVEQYLATLKKPDYMNYADTTKMKNIFKQRLDDKPLNRLIKYLKSYSLDKKWSVDMDPSITAKIKNRINKVTYIVRKELYKRYFSTPDFNESFYFFPLHYQPEASTMTFAQDYLDQLALIRNLVKHISAGSYLYVKEHPSMAVYRDMGFYKEICKIPSVKLLAPGVSTERCIERCLGVITLTGTAGYEAILTDKPVFVFGNVFYNDYDYIFRCNSIKDFYEKMRRVHLPWRTSSKREENRKAFIYAALDSLYDGNLNSHVYDAIVLEEENISRIATNLHQFFELHMMGSSRST